MVVAERLARGGVSSRVERPVSFGFPVGPSGGPFGKAWSEIPQLPQNVWRRVVLPQFAQVISSPISISNASWSNPTWSVRRSHSSATAATASWASDFEDRPGKVRRKRRRDEKRGGQDDRDDRTAGDTQRRPIAHRRAIAQPERTDRRADGARGDDRQGDRDGDDPGDPREWLTERCQPAGEQVDRAGDHLGAHERDRRCDAECRAVDDVVEAPIAEQQERPGDHHCGSRQRHEHAEKDDVAQLDPAEARAGGRQAAVTIPKMNPVAAPHSIVRAMTGIGVSS